MTEKEYLKKIDGKLTTLLNQPKTETWVDVTIIQELTGWNRIWLQKARANNLVVARKVPGKSKIMEYLLESVHPTFIKEKYSTSVGS